MERTMSVEEKIRRAEEIYARKQEGKNNNTARVGIYNKSEKKDIKLLKKMIIQIIICLIIYFVIYIIQNGNYIFSQDFLNKVNEVISYDTNFVELYQNIKNKISGVVKQQENDEEKQEEIVPPQEENIGGEEEQTENIDQQAQDLSQVETDIQTAKNTTSFIKPIEGTVSSVYGRREPTTASVPKNHTGIDLAATIGTKIKSATSGEVVLSSNQGDYGNHLKIQIGEISVIYAHCSVLYVNQGDIVQQGQEIAEVGSTGNSTGPHLHFEVRVSERTIDPSKILDF